MSRIDLLPTGGLCNRMRAIASAIILARELDRDLRIYWVKNYRLNSNFLDLFEPFDQTGVTLFDTHKTPWRFRTSSLRNLYVPSLLRFGRLHFNRDNAGELPGMDLTHVNPRKRILITSGYRFRYEPDIYKLFNPVPTLQKRIDAIAGSFRNTVGVHIRRTDNLKAIEHSPNSIFIQAMRDELDQDPSVRFYLATDDAATKREFADIFGEKISTLSVDNRRDSWQGMQDALVELYVLSRTKKVFGSYWSSFSHTACNIGGIPEITLKIDT